MHQVAFSEQQTVERQKLVKMIRQWGLVNTDGLLDETCHFYFHPKLEGFIGYRLEGSNAVVFGDPVCSRENRAAFAESFQEECASKNIGVAYTMATKEFAEWAAQNQGAITIEWGENYVVNPSVNPLNNKGSKAVLLRKKVKHALNDGVTIKEYVGNDLKIEEEIVRVAGEWLKRRHGLQVYLCSINLFQDREGKRWFYAEQGGQITGFLILNEIKDKGGWLLNNLMNTKDASAGLSELLITTTFQTLEKEGCHYVIIGPLPAEKLRDVKNANPLLAKVTRWLYTCATNIFHLKRWAVFWQKFQFEAEGSYLVFPEKNLNMGSVRSLLKAFNAGH